MKRVPVRKLQDKSHLAFKLVPSEREAATYKQSKEIGAHRDDHYIFFITLEGSGTTIVDFEEKVVGPNTLYYILPDQIHYRIITHQARGWYLAVDPALADPACRDIIEGWSGVQEPIILSAAEIRDYDQLLGILYRKAYEQESRMSVLHALLRAFLEMAAVTIQHSSKVAAHNSRPAMLAMQFKKLLNENIKRYKTPADYAKMLHISAPYLNEVLKEATGSTVSFWIKFRMLMEAKRLLYFTDLTVKQIAEELGFENHSYFSHIFYKETGMTALGFRKQFRERE
ncbi:helix-turn-helix transcriptional regulator [Chitinophaga sp.]|uniref:helix-turn-helix domain-containing protein n=1 Tax=Chitinophaga sp. TaxID=1869181 RepID=UPI0031CE68B9